MGSIVAIDIGYGDVKVFDGEKCYKFPTAVAPYSLSSFTNRVVDDKNSPFANEVVFTFEGRGYIVGEMALHDPDCMTTRSDSFILKHTPLFVYKTIRDIGYVPDTVVLGLPLGRYISKRSELFKREYAERIKKFVVNKEVVEINKVEIYAQGHGIYIDCITQKGNEGLSDEDAIVMDIGFNTVDVLSIVNGVPTKKNSVTMTGKGVVIMVRELDGYIRDNYEFELSEQALKKVLMNGSFRVYGKTVELADVIEEIKESYANLIIGELESRVGSAIQGKSDIGKIIVAGGGAYYIKDFLLNKYEDLIYVLESPEYANARGYYKLAVFMSEGE